jgi:hypothetical protein
MRLRTSDARRIRPKQGSDHGDTQCQQTPLVFDPDYQFSVMLARRDSDQLYP